MTEKRRSRAGMMVCAIGLCGGAAWLAASAWSIWEARAQNAAVLGELRKSRATFDHQVGRVRVSLLDSPGAESASEALIPLLERDRRLSWNHVDALMIRNGGLRDCDVLLVPGGSGRLKSEDLGGDGRRMVRDFVRHGGGYVGICGGAFLATSGYDWSLALVDAAALTGMIDCGEKEPRPIAARGSGMVSLEFSGVSKGIFSEGLSQQDVLYTSGPIFRYGNHSDLPASIVLAWFRTEIYECPSQQGSMIDTPAIIAAKFGRGTVLLFSPHPELSPRLNSAVIDAIAGCTNSEDVDSTPKAP